MKKIICLLGILAISLCCLPSNDLQIASSSVPSGEQCSSMIEALTQIVIKQGQMIAELQKVLEGLTSKVTAQVLSDIKKNGLYLGNRWKIAEEGTGSYETLVFRDMTSTNTGSDRRYVMFKDKYVNF